MAGRDVADVAVEAVVRIERVHAPHRPVADDLGDDGRGRDGRAALVAVHDGAMLGSKWSEAEAVDEANLGRRAEGGEGRTQAGEIGAVQAMAVNLLRRHDAHGDG